MCQKKDFQNGQNVPLDHPPNCGPVIKNVDDLPSGKVVSLFWNVFKLFFFRILLKCVATFEKVLKHLKRPFPLSSEEEEDNTYFEALVCNMETVTGNDKEFKRGSLEPDVLLDEELIKYHKKHPERSLAENAEQMLNELKNKLKDKLSHPQ